MCKVYLDASYHNNTFTCEIHYTNKIHLVEPFQVTQLHFLTLQLTTLQKCSLSNWAVQFNGYYINFRVQFNNYLSITFKTQSEKVAFKIMQRVHTQRPQAKLIDMVRFRVGVGFEKVERVLQNKLKRRRPDLSTDNSCFRFSSS